MLSKPTLSAAPGDEVGFNVEPDAVPLLLEVELGEPLESELAEGYC